MGCLLLLFRSQQPTAPKNSQCKHPWDDSSALQRCHINKNDCIQICRNTYSMTRPLVLIPGNFKSLLFNIRPELLNKTVWIQVFMFRSWHCLTCWCCWPLKDKQLSIYGCPFLVMYINLKLGKRSESQTHLDNRALSFPPTDSWPRHLVP